MRIRKHAARILSSLSINPTQTLASAAAAAGGRELEMHVCQLNQSPWDAMAFTPPGSVSFFPYQELEEVEEDNGFAWSAHSEEQEATAAAVSDVSGITAAESNSWRRQVIKVEVMAEQAAAEGEQRERRSEYSYAKKRSTSSCISNITKKTKRKSTTSSHAAGAAVEIKLENIIPPPAAAAAASTCKKNDGKGWHCKRPAQHPHSLCEYHLNQVRSYYGNGVGTGHTVHHRHHHQQQALPKAPQDAALIIPDDNNKKKNKKNKTTTTAKKGSSRGHKSSDGAGGRRRWRTEEDFFSYYSGFGPWRGKRRCGGADSDRGGRRWSSSNVDASVDGDDEQRDATAEAGPPDHGAHSPSPVVHDQAPDDLDDDDEDMDGGDGVGSRDGGDDVAAGRRRARKPIKARSLKSLL